MQWRVEKVQKEKLPSLDVTVTRETPYLARYTPHMAVSTSPMVDSPTKRQNTGVWLESSHIAHALPP